MCSWMDPRERVLVKVLLVSGLVGVVSCVLEERLESGLRFVKWFPSSVLVWWFLSLLVFRNSNVCRCIPCSDSCLNVASYGR